MSISAPKDRLTKEANKDKKSQSRNTFFAKAVGYFSFNIINLDFEGVVGFGYP